MKKLKSGSKTPLSNAERQRVFRAKKRDEGKTEILISLPKETIIKIDDLAKKEGLTRNEIIGLILASNTG